MSALLCAASASMAQTPPAPALAPVLHGTLGSMVNRADVIHMPPEVREALHGVISPDGRAFAYEAVENHDRNIWLMDFARSWDRQLTNGPGTRNDPVWSPDGDAIAFTMNGFSAIGVVDVWTGTTRVVFDTKPHGFSHPWSFNIAWVSDTELTFDVVTDGMQYAHGPRSRWSVGVDGTNAHPIAPPAPPDTTTGVVSPDGRWTVVARRCCGRGSGMWLSSTSDGRTRCVAGPIQFGTPYWSPTSDAFTFAAEAPHDSAAHAYVVSVPDGRARRVAGVTGSVINVTANARGDVAIVTRTGAAVKGQLWIGRMPLAVIPSDTLPACPDPYLPSDIPRWVAAQSLPAVQSVTELAADASRGVSAFQVYYGWGGDVTPSIYGLRVNNRIGWLLPAPNDNTDEAGRRLIRFPLDASDAYLFSAAWDSTLMSDAPQFGQWWRTLLAQTPITPVATLRRLAVENPSLATELANHPALNTPGAPKDLLLDLAGQGPEPAIRVMNAPAIAQDVDALLWIADRYREYPDVEQALDRQLAKLSPTLIRDPHAPERALFALALSSIHSGDPSVLNNPVIRQSRRILAVFAATAIGAVGDSVQQALSAQGLTPESAFAEFLRTQVADSVSCEALSHIVNGSRFFAESPRLQVELLTGAARRCLQLQHDVRGALASRSTTPLDELRFIASGLIATPDRGVADALINNPRVRSDTTSLRLLRLVPLSAIALEAEKLGQALNTLQGTFTH